MRYRTLTLKQGHMITDGIVDGLQTISERNGS
jgi:cell division transport system ATP-binding protein